METPQTRPDAEQADHNAVTNPFAEPKKHGFRIRRLAKIPGLLVFALLAAWLNWDQLEKVPGVSLAAEHIYDQIANWMMPLPRATGDRFAVAIVRLENDRQGVHQNLITTALADVKDIEPLVLDRTIAVRGSTPQSQIRAAQEQAQELLMESHTDVLIWGQVLHVDRQATLKLHWIAAPEAGTKAHDSAAESHDLDMPEPSWHDLSDVLGMIVTTERARRAKQQGPH